MDLGDELSPDLQRETDALRRIARGILFEPGLAEDAVQEAWLAALKAEPFTVSGGTGTMGSWLNEAVRRIALGLRRSEARRGRRERAAARAEELPSAADTAARVELLGELLAVLRALDEPYRTAVQLRLVEDLAPREIARRLGVPVETARTRIKRGIGELRARLDGRHEERRHEFLALLAPLAGLQPWAGTLGGGLAAAATQQAIGGAWMSLQAKVAVSAALVLAAGMMWWRPWGDETERSERAGPSVPAVALDASAPSADEGSAQRAPETLAPAREPVRAAEPAARDERAGTWLVRGRVVRDGDVPLAGVDVRITVVTGYEGEGESLHEERVRTAQSGAFTLALDPPAAAVRVSAQVVTRGYLGFGTEALVLSGAPPPDLFVGCYTVDVTLRGRVLDPRRNPVAGAHVRFVGDAVDTDAEGRFELGSSTHFGETTLTAWGTGFAECERTIQTTNPGEVLEGIELVLRPEALLRGRVSDEAGRPVAGAEVSCFGFGHAHALSAADGRFELRGLPADADWLGVGVRARGFARSSQDLPDGRVPSEELVFVLQRAVDLRGWVVDHHGAGLPGATLFVGRSQFDVDAIHGVAGDEGAFSLDDVPRSALTIHVEASGLAPLEQALDLPERGEPAALTLVLRPGRTLAGQVVDEAGVGLTGIRIALRAGGSYLGEGLESGANGSFALTNVPEQSGLELVAYGTGFVRSKTPLEPLTSEVRIQMERAAGLCGRVLDAATGKPVTAFKVRFVRAELARGEREIQGYDANWADGGREFRDEEGRWDTRDEELSAGSLTGLEITAPGYGPALEPRAMATLAPERVPIVITLGAPARVEGEVVDAATGQAVAGVLVRVVLAGAGTPRGAEEATVARTTSDARGAFGFVDLPVRALALVVESPDFASAVDGPFAADARTPWRRVALTHGASLQGTVRDRAGRLVEAAVVLVNLLDPTTQEYRSWRLAADAEGRFELGYLSLGSYQVALEVRRGEHVAFDLSRQVEIRAERPHTLELRPLGSGRIVGSVHGGSGKAATVMARRPDAGPGEENVSRATFVDEERFELDGLESGRWTLMISEGWGSGSRAGSAEVDVHEESVETVRVELVAR